MPEDLSRFSNENVSSRLSNETLATPGSEDNENLTKIFSLNEGGSSNNDYSMIKELLTFAPVNGTEISCDGNILQYRIVPALIMASCFVFGVLCWLFGELSRVHILLSKYIYFII